MVSEAAVEAFVARARYGGPTITADRLVAVDACLRQLGGQLALIARPELAARFGLEPSGTLFIGPPGTGKTVTARFLAGQLVLPFYEVSANEFGSDPELLHGVFRRLALANAGMVGGLWVIGACTADIQLDPAIHRSGRLGVIVEFAAPSEWQRLALFRLYLDGVPHAVDEGGLVHLAEAAIGATGADIRDWVSQAASEALAETDVAEPLIAYRHLETVVARRGFIAATDRPGREPDWETAVHESAHAIAAWRLFARDALARVTIGFGSAAGALEGFSRGHFALSDEWAQDHPPTSATWEDHVAVALAGACAVDALLGHRGHGAETDVASATTTILAQLEQGDPAFGPSRQTIETTGAAFGAVVGSEPMRRLAWDLTRSRFERAWARTARLGCCSTRSGPSPGTRSSRRSARRPQPRRRGRDRSVDATSRPGSGARVRV